MNLWQSEITLALALLASLLLCVEIGRWLGRRREDQHPGQPADDGAGPLDAAVFALVGLLIAFCFSRAASRLALRREMIVTHANSIRTAWLRIDLLPDDTQPALRQTLRDYVDVLLLARNASDRDPSPELLSRLDVLASGTW